MRIRNHGNYGHGLREGTDWDMNCPTCQFDRERGNAPVITEDGFGPGVKREIYAKSIDILEFRKFVDAVDAANVQGTPSLVRNAVGAPIAAIIPLHMLPADLRAKLPVYVRRVFDPFAGIPGADAQSLTSGGPQACVPGDGPCCGHTPCHCNYHAEARRLYPSRSQQEARYHELAARFPNVDSDEEAELDALRDMLGHPDPFAVQP